ncbi:MAG: RNA polymerase sigma factor [Rhodocyclaceae bacterium]|nr:RNA polymerase sigma factor [Rhodocyclaceae bacterium]MBX3666884.1 RNA polymerase sigma factor [Rhodocyclaceae bacterium]
MTDARSDEALMLAYRDGDAAAFEVLYARWRSRLYRYLLHQCGERGLAEDLYQEIWTKLIAAREHYEIHAKFSTWLFTIAHRRLIDHYRRSSARPTDTALWQDEDDQGDPLDTFAGPEVLEPQRQAHTAELRAGLLAALDALPAPQREAFLLVEEGDLSLEDAARVAGVGRETLKSRLRYALGKLRAALAEFQS